MRRRRNLLLTGIIIMLAGMYGFIVQAGTYEAVTVSIPIGGAGTFQIKEAGAEDAEAIEKKEIEGSGSMEMTYSDPGRYVYELFSEDAVNVKRYSVIVDVMTNEEAQLSALVTLAVKDADRKVPVAYYPVTLIDPPIVKRVEGEGAPANEVYQFEFRAVSTTAEGLEGKLPMPEGVEGQSMTVEVTGAGSAESGTILLSEPGTYIYEYRELEGKTAGITYDKSVYSVQVEVIEGEKCLETKTKIIKDGVEIDADKIEFVNQFKAPETPQTGDPSKIVLWCLIGGGACILLCGIVIYMIKSRKEEDAQ